MWKNTTGKEWAVLKVILHSPQRRLGMWNCTEDPKIYLCSSERLIAHYSQSKAKHQVSVWQWRSRDSTEIASFPGFVRFRACDSKHFQVQPPSVANLLRSAIRLPQRRSSSILWEKAKLLGLFAQLIIWPHLQMPCFFQTTVQNQTYSSCSYIKHIKEATTNQLLY